MASERATDPFIACPCCGLILRDHSGPTAEDYEEWTFACGARIQFDEDFGYVPAHPCRQGLNAALGRMRDGRSVSVVRESET